MSIKQNVFLRMKVKINLKKNYIHTRLRPILFIKCCAPLSVISFCHSEIRLRVYMHNTKLDGIRASLRIRNALAAKLAFLEFGKNDSSHKRIIIF